jgi:hypothetical protein
MLINYIILTIINDPLSKGALKVFQGWETTRSSNSEILEARATAKEHRFNSLVINEHGLSGDP